MYTQARAALPAATANTWYDLNETCKVSLHAQRNTKVQAIARDTGQAVVKSRPQPVPASAAISLGLIPLANRLRSGRCPSVVSLNKSLLHYGTAKYKACTCKRQITRIETTN
eukprot:1655943-Pleurochrysis_carterae.AAC.2